MQQGSGEVPEKIEDECKGHRCHHQKVALAGEASIATRKSGGG